MRAILGAHCLCANCPIQKLALWRSKLRLHAWLTVIQLLKRVVRIVCCAGTQAAESKHCLVAQQAVSARLATFRPTTQAARCQSPGECTPLRAQRSLHAYGN